MKPGASRTLLYALIAIMVLLWSANFIVAKVLLRELPPLLAGSLRIVLAAVFAIPMYLWQEGKLSGVKGDWFYLACLGIFGVGLNQVFFMVGLSRTSVAHAALIISMSPILVLLTAAAIGQESITTRKWVGMLIAAGGVAILNTVPSRGFAPGAGPTLTGDLLVFLGGLAFALCTVFGKKISARHSPITLNTFCYLSGGAALIPVVLWQTRDFPLARLSAAAWTSLAFMALFPSLLCYLIYFYALRHIPASRVAAFSYLQPVLATAMAVATLGERVSLPLVAGGAVIFSGVYLTERG